MASANSTPVTGSYCQDIASKALGAPEEGKEKAVDWSPNDVRRLIISPDMIVVQFFTHAMRRQIIDPNKYMACTMTGKYKPMIGVLAGQGRSYVCSNVEEVVICMKSSNSNFNLQLQRDEANYLNLIDKTKLRVANGVSADKAVLNEINSRFKRLRAVLYFNCDINTFCNQYLPMGQQPTTTLADNSHIMKIAQIHSLKTKDTWWREYALRPANYPRVDAKGGTLENRFLSVRKHFEKMQATESAEKAKKEYVGELSEKWKTAVKNYKQIVFAIVGMYSLIRKNEKGAYSDAARIEERIRTMVGTIVKLNPVAYADLDKAYSEDKKFMGLLRGIGVQVTDADKISGDLKTVYNDATQIIMTASHALYGELCSLFADTIVTLYISFPYVISVICSEYKGSIQIIGKATNSLAQLSKIYKGSLEQGSMTNSTRNMCCVLALLALSDTAVRQTKAGEQGYWEHVMLSQ